MRTHFVDSLLGHLEGAASPAWITVALLTDRPPDPEALRHGMRRLFALPPRLNLARTPQGWTPHTWTPTQLHHALTTSDSPQPLPRIIQEKSNEPAHLESKPALRLHIAPVSGQREPRWTVLTRMHHAMGDARAQGRTLARLWQATAGKAIPPDPSPLCLWRDRDLLAWSAGQPRAAARLLDPAARLLSPRALALDRDSDEVGEATASSLRLAPLRDPGDQACAEVFLAATLATAARFTRAREGLLRLRMPLDLSRELGWRGLLGNTCMAVPLEFHLQQVRDRDEDPDALRRLLRAALGRAIEEKHYVATALECLLSARLVPPRLLRRQAPHGLLAQPRTNTLVTTYVGRLDDYIVDTPFPVLDILSHTSTWGIHAWTLRGRMTLNATAFDKLWSPQTLDRFVHQAAAWIERHHLTTPSPTQEA